MKRKKPVEGAVKGWYVYVNMIVKDGVTIPFFVGVCNKPYEFRRYSNRPKDWTSIARLNNKCFTSIILVDCIPDYRLALMIYRLTISYYQRRGEFVINTPVVLKRTPQISKDKTISDHLARLIEEYNLKAKINGHTMRIDTSKRNYHPKFLSTNDQ